MSDERTWRILRRDPNTIETITRWDELEPLTMPYADAAEIGEAYGEGEYLLIEQNSEYSYHSTLTMTVVADKRWREAEKVEA